MARMAVIREQDLDKGRAAFAQWRDAAESMLDDAGTQILDGPASDPHNLTPPDVIELDPEVWLRLAAGITTWDEEKTAGRITAVGERDNLSDLLPLA